MSMTSVSRPGLKSLLSTLIMSPDKYRGARVVTLYYGQVPNDGSGTCIISTHDVAIDHRAGDDSAHSL